MRGGVENAYKISREETIETCRYRRWDNIKMGLK
jgi:hypothetical protein